MINSNHKDGLRKHANDRRVAPFYTAQQNASDLRRDKMDGDYFGKLYAWLKNGGYAIVSELLHTMPIADEYNPATGCQRAPITTSTPEAIAMGLGSVEQEIAEAIEQGLPGFAGGWVSSMALDSLLERKRAEKLIPRNKRRDLLVNLGYDWHPALDDGRVNNVTLPDGGKPRLFIRGGHPAASITSPAEVQRAYTDAQTAKTPFKA
jgi:hypothetical protein